MGCLAGESHGIIRFLFFLGLFMQDRVVLGLILGFVSVVLVLLFR